MGTTVVIESVVASELPEAWRQRVKAKGNEVLTVTIAKRKTQDADRRKDGQETQCDLWHVG